MIVSFSFFSDVLLIVFSGGLMVRVGGGCFEELVILGFCWIDVGGVFFRRDSVFLI